MITLPRRRLLGAFASLLAAPAIVKADALMKIGAPRIVGKNPLLAFPYGRSPGMALIEDIRALNALIQAQYYRDLMVLGRAQMLIEETPDRKWFKLQHIPLCDAEQTA